MGLRFSSEAKQEAVIEYMREHICVGCTAPVCGLGSIRVCVYAYLNCRFGHVLQQPCVTDAKSESLKCCVCARSPCSDFLYYLWGAQASVLWVLRSSGTQLWAPMRDVMWSYCENYCRVTSVSFPVSNFLCITSVHFRLFGLWTWTKLNKCKCKRKGYACNEGEPQRKCNVPFKY